MHFYLFVFLCWHFFYFFVIFSHYYSTLVYTKTSFYDANEEKKDWRQQHMWRHGRLRNLLLRNKRDRKVMKGDLPWNRFSFDSLRFRAESQRKIVRGTRKEEKKGEGEKCEKLTNGWKINLAVNLSHSEPRKVDAGSYSRTSISKKVKWTHDTDSVLRKNGRKVSSLKQGFLRPLLGRRAWRGKGVGGGCHVIWEKTSSHL